MKPAALIALTEGGVELALRIKSALPGATIHGLSIRTDGADVPFGDLAPHLQALFAERVPIIGICAAGILIRCLAGVISDKRQEASVLAVAEDASAVVPLLGGHRGANGLAHDIARCLGISPAITTAGDVRLGLALDDPPKGWRAANAQAAKAVTAALLAGEPVRLEIEAGDGAWLLNSGARFAEAADHAIVLTERDLGEAEGDGKTLVLNPATLALGVGCVRGAEPGELIALARETLASANLAPGAVACVVSIDLKADEAAVHAVAEDLGVPARFFTSKRLERETPRLLNPSLAVYRETGCHGVAEGAALAAAGVEAELIVAKRKTANATCAIARADRAIDAEETGQARGRLHIVGIGPGDPALLTGEARGVLAAAEEVVGYTLYLDLLGPTIAAKRRHAFPIGAEAERARSALDLAAEGRVVALVSSGDAGIYALASLVFELLDAEERADWNRVAISIAPGISAMQAAAAAAGAPLGHDFCAISLSDLLTPWADIERRLGAAGEGDFVVALYNPASARRRHQIIAARDILLRSRDPETPVLIARNLARKGEEVRIIPLADLGPDDADMTTLVIIGNSRTRLITRGQRR
ncbi:MAG: precorrin-3B C(17)-methyltransferase, partial [Proteobacteria bacterium]|nr:precorrin-3B C(17)-methyltransferase [Pseudomonadota bacterium]